jgi:hypothetical protein
VIIHNTPQGIAVASAHATSLLPSQQDHPMARKTKKRIVRPYTRDDVKTLRAHSKARTPIVKISKQMKRTVGSLRQKALKLGIGLGHSR